MDRQIKKDRRKVLLLLPLLVLPFLALGFYALGGGRGDVQLVRPVSGINTGLPDASFSADTPKTKADYYKQGVGEGENSDNGISAIAGQLGFEVEGKGAVANGQEQTKLIDEKLQALHREINRPEVGNDKPAPAAKVQPSSIRSDVDRLEALMKTMQENKTEDPEMAQLSGMMQNILDIQHPERISERQRLARSMAPDSQFRATIAIIVDNQKAVQGGAVKIRLMDSLRIGGMLVPKGHELFGACRITNQRILIEVKNIRLGTSIVPVDLSVYSLDGMVGLDAPEAALTGALNEGADNAVRSVGFGFDTSVGAQVAGAGIDAARQLISRKVKKIKVKLSAGTSVLLRNNKPMPQRGF